jgi:hypothetical protein
VHLWNFQKMGMESTTSQAIEIEPVVEQEGANKK